MKECQNIEWKETWSDDFFKWICGFANVLGELRNIFSINSLKSRRTFQVIITPVEKEK